MFACSSSSSVPPVDTNAALRVDTAEPVATVDPRFLSVAVDTAQVVGGRFWSSSGEQEVIGEEEVPEYDFTRPRLRALASHLAPAFLRIGGSDADRVIYDMTNEPIEEAPEGFEFVLTAALLDGIFEFSEALDFQVAFTLNAGVGVRDASNAWTPDMARELVTYVLESGYDVSLWEFGNEWNVYGFILGLGLDFTEIVDDFRVAGELLDELDPETPFGGPSSAYWPTPGEILQAVYPNFMAMGGSEIIDVITWHYYPQQSQRCPFRTDPYEPEGLLNAEGLDRGIMWAEEVQSVRDQRAPDLPIWLRESGHAQCGGQPDSSDRFEGTFWWMDQLGAMAQRGHQVAVRQTLSGSNYGLIDDVTLEPRPDYWASVLWRRLMGVRALGLFRDEVDPSVRAYAHCTRDRPGAVTVLAINLDPDRSVRIDVAALGGTKEIHLLTAEALDSAQLMLNGTALRDTDGELPDLSPEGLGNRPADLPPRSIAFITYPDADAAACR